MYSLCSSARGLRCCFATSNGGCPVAAIYFRRLAALAAFGFITEAGFGFEILREYAIWGVPLLLIRKWRSRALLAVAVLAVAVTPTVFAVRALARQVRPVSVSEDAPPAARPDPQAARGRGDGSLPATAARAPCEHALQVRFLVDVPSRFDIHALRDWRAGVPLRRLHRSSSTAPPDFGCDGIRVYRVGLDLDRVRPLS